jgi:hypothetical protein
MKSGRIRGRYKNNVKQENEKNYMLRLLVILHIGLSSHTQISLRHVTYQEDRMRMRFRAVVYVHRTESLTSV